MKIVFWSESEKQKKIFHKLELGVTQLQTADVTTQSTLSVFPFPEKQKN
jgi:hypothetical protein